MSASHRLSRFRKTKALSLRQLAKELEIDHSHALRLCSGDRSPSLALALRISTLTKSWSLGPIEPSEWVKQSTKKGDHASDG